MGLEIMDLIEEEISTTGEYGQVDLHFNLMKMQLDLLIASLVHKHYLYGKQSNNLQSKIKEIIMQMDFKFMKGMVVDLIHLKII